MVCLWHLAKQEQPVAASLSATTVLRFTTLKGFRLSFLIFPEIKRILVFRLKEVIVKTFLPNLDEVSLCS